MYNAQMGNIKIIHLEPEDWRLYKQIRLEALLAEPQAYSSLYAEVVQRPDTHWRERLVEALAGKKSWLLFAREAERVIGMIGAYCPAENDTVEIISMYVTKEKRRQGAASALMAAILNEVSRENVFRKAKLAVNASQSAAVALYQVFGFQIIETNSGVMGDGREYQGYIMEKDLGRKA